MKFVSRPTSLPGSSFAIAAAVLFGASTPFSKILLGKMDPIMLAGVLYLGSGTGLTTWWLLRRRSRGSKGKEAGLRLADLPWLVGAILAGGVVGPILLMMGLRFTRRLRPRFSLTLRAC
jgi:drug/metabolite transporter (DMT)-like permease